jgi:hypothetical protein
MADFRQAPPETLDMTNVGSAVSPCKTHLEPRMQIASWRLAGISKELGEQVEPLQMAYRIAPYCRFTNSTVQALLCKSFRRKGGRGYSGSQHETRSMPRKVTQVIFLIHYSGRGQSRQACALRQPELSLSPSINVHTPLQRRCESMDISSSPIPSSPVSTFRYFSDPG